jgi:phosphoserine phosphatase
MTPGRSNGSLDAFLDYAGARSGEKPLAVFDCDGTLVRGDIGEAMLCRQLEHFLFRVSPASVWRDHPDREALDGLYRGLSAAGASALSHRAYEPLSAMVLDWYYGQMAIGRTPKACADIVRLLAGYTTEEALAMARETLHAELASPLRLRRLGGRLLPAGIRYIAETARALRRLVRDGWDIVVISGSNRWSVEAVFAPFGVGPDRIIGIDLLRSGETLEGTPVEPIPVFEGKVKALRTMTRRKPDIFFSDSRNDIPLFRESKFRVLVSLHGDPPDEIFRKAGGSRRDDWYVIESPTLHPDGIPF